MNSPSRQSGDDERPPLTPSAPPPPPPASASASTLTQLFSGENNTLASEVDGDAIKKLATSFPFVLLLIFRFLIAYVVKFFSLLFINVLLYRIQNIFEEQISLKSSTSRNTLFTLLTVSLGLLSAIYLLASPLLGVDIVPRLSLAPFHSVGHDSDFISIVMLCYFSDCTLKLLVVTVKILLFFLLNPRSRAPDNSTPIFPFPNLACLHWDRAPTLSSITPRGIVDGLLSMISPRSRHRDSNRDLTSLHLAADEPDLESGSLLSGTDSRLGRRRVVGYSTSRDNMTASGPGRERRSSSSSVDEQSQLESETIEHQSEVMSYMRLKRMFGFVDSICAFYRSILPIPVWNFYFSSGPGSDVLPFCYFFLKGVFSIDDAALAFIAFNAIVIEKLEFGSFSTQEELIQSGSPNCAICFDAYYRPITLSCNHIFCQHCIHEWLDHENTCPVCRAEVSRDQSSQNIRNLSASAAPVIM